jgi:hypothetical protein
MTAEDKAEAAALLAILEIQRRTVLEDQESIRALLARNISFLREVDATIAEAKAILAAS